ncbi:vacuolar fusion protein MON1 homolog A isoform X2 [Dermacentor andersoni]|uniref:vacuolar fusion protein MON1 homolog A isoform X2 n=1 Tax=Dermacentor andersoni TaxID=34620 RepID=UPI002155B8F5|nr:vacuolar fusion protein MON1 homolog A-like isoform X2 [Dermacentor andersoni]
MASVKADVTNGERPPIDSSLTGEARLIDDEGDIPKDFEPGASKDPIILSVDSSSDLESHVFAQGDGGMSPRSRSKSTINEIERSASEDDVPSVQGRPPSDTSVQEVDVPSAEDVTEASSAADLLGPELGALAEDWDNHAWRQQEKHVFVLSDAGKPIYCRHGSEEQLAALAGVMQALVSCIALSGDQVRYVRAGRLRLAFLLRLPLILVAATSLPLSLQQLQAQLVYVHAQILSVVTASQLERVFNRRCNFDLRRLLAGSERFLDSLCDLMDRDPSFLLGAVRCLPLAPALRDQITQAMLKHCAKHKKLVFGLLVAEQQLVALVGMRKYQLHHVDLHLLLNLVHASESFKTAEAWTPVCLPKFDPSGFLHAHVSYLAEGSPACLLLLTVDRDLFFPLQECRRKIAESLQRKNCLEALREATVSGGYSVREAGVPELYHFLYKSKSGAQLSSPRLEPPYSKDPGRLLALYRLLHHRMYQPACPLKILFWATGRETLMGWHMAGFELYAAFEPLVSKDTAVRAMSKLLHWIKQEEERLFIMSYATL